MVFSFQILIAKVKQQKKSSVREEFLFYYLLCLIAAMKGVSERERDRQTYSERKRKIDRFVDKMLQSNSMCRLLLSDA